MNNPNKKDKKEIKEEDAQSLCEDLFYETGRVGYILLADEIKKSKTQDLDIEKEREL